MKMKKLPLISTLFFGAYLNFYGCKTFEQELKELKIPEVTYCFMKATNIQYIEDKKDDWKIPEITELEGGDCEDRAEVLRYCLFKKNIFARTFCGKRHTIDDSGHAWGEYKKGEEEFILDPGEFVGKRSGLNQYQYIKMLCVPEQIKDYEKRLNNSAFFFFNNFQ